MTAVSKHVDYYKPLGLSIKDRDTYELADIKKAYNEMSRK